MAKSIERKFFGTDGVRDLANSGKMTPELALKLGRAFIRFNHGRKIIIGRDTRLSCRMLEGALYSGMSSEGANVLLAGVIPTPGISYAVKELHADGGAVISASHNPAEYNGYKVYWEDGAQIVSPVDKEIMSEVKAVTDFSEIKEMDEEEAIKKGLYYEIGEDVDTAYMEELKKLVLNKDVITKVQKDLKIVYTPLHGTGNLPVQKILKEIGFENVYVVPEQEKPDGNFSTVTYPNPEDKKAFELALNLAKKIDADIVLATDPDADRLGIYAKDTKTGEYMPFTGNMSGLLIAEYELSQRKEKGKLPENGALITTIVPSNMAGAIAKNYNIELIEVLTGFKYIGEKMKLFEETKEHEYLFGYEESYGCLIGTHARDKDAIVAVMALCEAAAYYKDKNLTLWDQMINIYEKYGYYKEGQISITMKGLDGAEKIKAILEKLRNNPPKTIGKYKVIEYRDYMVGTIENYEENKKSKTTLPTSNVLYYTLENDAWVCARPSGTEPKIKFYIGIKAESMEKSNTELEDLSSAVRVFGE